jgi:predicted component of type VI protein secretion system
MAFLTIMTGALKGTRVEIDKDEISIGRAPTNSISLDDAAVSGKHCAVVRDGGKFSIRDLGSTNGTRLNAKPVKESRLNPKDVIMVGAVEIRIEGDDIEPWEAPAPATASSPVPPTIVTSSRFSQGDTSTVFGKKRDNRGVWFVVLGIVGLLALVAMVFFFIRVFHN